MRRLRHLWLVAAVSLGLLGGCATPPINPPISEIHRNEGYRFDTRDAHRGGVRSNNLVVLAFSGGGTRAAAFSYGVLEALRRMEVVTPDGRKTRLLDQVDIVSGVSGGSFTALAYGLYQDKLFDLYESSFLKRNVQRELIARAMNPVNWGALSSPTWGRSELAAQLYDDILFHGATFADLDRGTGPFVLVTATDISTGARLGFNQSVFDLLCSDLDAVPLSRAAAASSAVPFVLSPVTINNYGGHCNYSLPAWLLAFSDRTTAPRPGARMIRHLEDLDTYLDSAHNPYIHLVDGGLADNLGLRGVLEVMDTFEALHMESLPTPLDRARRIVVFVVKVAFPCRTPTGTDRIAPPSDVALLIEASPRADRSLFIEGVELLRTSRHDGRSCAGLRRSAVVARNEDPALTRLVDTRRGPVCHRRVVPRPGRQGGIQLPEQLANVIQAAGGSSRSPARRRRDHHPCIAGIPPPLEGRRGEAGRRALGYRGAGIRAMTLLPARSALTSRSWPGSPAPALRPRPWRANRPAILRRGPCRARSRSLTRRAAPVPTEFPHRTTGAQYPAPPGNWTRHLRTATSRPGWHPPAS